MAQPIPQALSHLIALNTDYRVLICVSSKCKYALEPSAISRHLRDRHETALELRKQVEQYVAGFPFAYSHASVPLPPSGLAPQPIIPVVDGFVCRDCPEKSVSPKWMRKHGNKVHNKKRVPNEDIFQAVRLQSWFGEKRERYWAVDESQQITQERQARRAAIGDVGEESNSEANTSGSSESEDSQDDRLSDSLDDIIEEIEGWKADACERLLEALKKVPAAEIDAWLHFTGWNEVLGQSKHNLVKTHQFAHPPNPDEPELERVLRAWRRILERCLDTLAATNQKDALKWWGSPKNEAAS